MAGLLMVAVGLLGSAAVSPPLAPTHAVVVPVVREATIIPASVRYQTEMVVEQVKRKVYPYSVVPGGAQSLREAKVAMTDPAVKAHYAVFNLGVLRQEKLAGDLKGYVSYRWGDQIYWTAKKITLHAGETVFTDGTHVARGRCLNCYSALPMQPIRPHEPTEKALDVAIEMPMTVYSFPERPLFVPALPIPPGELTPTVPVLPATAPLAPGGGAAGGGPWFPLIPIIPPIHHHPKQPPGSPYGPPPPGGGSPSGPTPPPPPPPVAVVPEPNYGIFLLGGFLVIALVYRLRRGTA